MLHLFKKSTALLLVISMLLGVLCLSAFAVDEETVLKYIIAKGYSTLIFEFDGEEIEIDIPRYEKEKFKKILGTE